MIRLPRRLLLFALLIGGIASIPLTDAPAQEAAEASPAASPETTPEIELRVMTFNVWLGGVQVDFAKVAEAVRAADADVVGLQEVEGHAGRLAAALGWEYVDRRLQVISRYPLVDPPGGDGVYTFVEPRPGRVVAIANVHLTSDPYGPEAVRDGQTPEAVLTLERETRLPGIERHLAVVPTLVAAGIPVFLTGDFNTPSHLDWTTAVDAAREQVRYPLAWPVGEALAGAGLRDSYREAHPDPVRRLGLTWTPGYPHPLLRPTETFDRIDWVLVAGAATTVASQLVGETGGPDVDVGVTPWPSDHRGVVSTFRVTPGTPPPLVAVHERAVTAGEELIVRYHGPGEEGDRVAIVPAGGNPATDVLTSLPTGESAADGSLVFGTRLLPPAPYDAVLLGATGAELARIPFWVLAEGAVPTLRMTKPVYAPGEPIDVSWTNAPGYRWDWLGVYAKDEVDLGNYLTYLYAEAEIAGSLVFDAAAFGEPLPPGEYEVRLLRDDGYVLLAATSFAVAADAA